MTRFKIQVLLTFAIRELCKLILSWSIHNRWPCFLNDLFYYNGRMAWTLSALYRYKNVIWVRFSFSFGVILGRRVITREVVENNSQLSCQYLPQGALASSSYQLLHCRVDRALQAAASNRIHSVTVGVLPLSPTAGSTCRLLLCLLWWPPSTIVPSPLALIPSTLTSERKRPNGQSDGRQEEEAAGLRGGCPTGTECVLSVVAAWRRHLWPEATMWAATTVTSTGRCGGWWRRAHWCRQVASVTSLKMKQHKVLE